jgi:hypothetical protein
MTMLLKDFANATKIRSRRRKRRRTYERTNEEEEEAREEDGKNSGSKKKWGKSCQLDDYIFIRGVLGALVFQLFTRHARGLIIWVSTISAWKSLPKNFPQIRAYLATLEVEERKKGRGGSEAARQAGCRQTDRQEASKALPLEAHEMMANVICKVVSVSAYTVFLM